MGGRTWKYWASSGPVFYVDAILYLVAKRQAGAKKSVCLCLFLKSYFSICNRRPSIIARRGAVGGGKANEAEGIAAVSELMAAQPTPPGRTRNGTAHPFAPQKYKRETLYDV